MITATFTKGGASYMQAHVTGHAQFAAHGQDIVCAAVSSAVMLTANAITDVIGQDANLCVLENEVSIKLPLGHSIAASDFLRALHLHLVFLQQEYPEHISVMEE